MANSFPYKSETDVLYYTIAAARELEGTAKSIEVNCDERPELKATYHIHAYPTFILFRDGMEAWRAEGRIPERELDAMVRKFQ